MTDFLFQMTQGQLARVPLVDSRMYSEGNRVFVCEIHRMRTVQSG